MQLFQTLPFDKVRICICKERFWRIPGKLKADDLRSRAAALAPPSEDAGKSSSSSGRYAVLKALVKQKKENTASEKRKRFAT